MISDAFFDISSRFARHASFDFCHFSLDYGQRAVSSSHTLTFLRVFDEPLPMAADSFLHYFRQPPFSAAEFSSPAFISATYATPRAFAVLLLMSQLPPPYWRFSLITIHAFRFIVSL